MLRKLFFDLTEEMKDLWTIFPVRFFFLFQNQVFLEHLEIFSIFFNVCFFLLWLSPPRRKKERWEQFLVSGFWLLFLARRGYAEDRQLKTVSMWLILPIGQWTVFRLFRRMAKCTRHMRNVQHLCGLVWFVLPPSHFSPSYSVSCFCSLFFARDRLQLSTLSSSSTLHRLWRTHQSGISLRWTNGTLSPQRSTTSTSTVSPVQRRRTKRSALIPFPKSFAMGQSSSRTSTGGSMKPSH